MVGSMMTQKGLPSTYNKDLQESWEPMLDHVKTVSDSIQIAEGALATLGTQPEKMKAALDPFILAANVAEYLAARVSLSARLTTSLAAASRSPED
ncbi:argininosuccinate lyase [Colletotrichum graminicola]|nr:argininosuccinate lyase [Colletotrichum graminicola]